MPSPLAAKALGAPGADGVAATAAANVVDGHALAALLALVALELLVKGEQTALVVGSAQIASSAPPGVVWLVGFGGVGGRVLVLGQGGGGRRQVGWAGGGGQVTRTAAAEGGRVGWGVWVWLVQAEGGHWGCVEFGFVSGNGLICWWFG